MNSPGIPYAILEERILSLLLAMDCALSIREIGDSMDLTKTTTHNVMTRLEESRLVKKSIAPLPVPPYVQQNLYQLSEHGVELLDMARAPPTPSDRSLKMVTKTGRTQGVLGIQVRSRDNRWVTLPCLYYYGRAREVAGGKRVECKTYEQALAEAQGHVRGLRAQNPGHQYEIVRPPNGQAEIGLIWVPIARDRIRS